jgi:hypothetical protein
MRKKKKSKSDSYVLQAHRRAHAWAEKAILYRAAGKIAQAKAAAQKARQWLRKAAAALE